MNNSTMTLPNGSMVTLIPMNVAEKQGKRKVELDSCALLAFSVINIFLWIISTVLQAAILVGFNGGLFDVYWNTLDVGGWGIWCSWFYMVAGFTGYSASYNKKKSLIITSMVFAVFSLITSITAASFAGIQGSETSSYPSYYCRSWEGMNVEHIWYYECSVWASLEWSLMGFSIIAFFVNLAVIIITSMAVCSCCRRKSSNSNFAATVLPPNGNVQYFLSSPSGQLNPAVAQQPLYIPVAAQQPLTQTRHQKLYDQQQLYPQVQLNPQQQLYPQVQMNPQQQLLQVQQQQYERTEQESAVTPNAAIQQLESVGVTVETN